MQYEQKTTQKQERKPNFIMEHEGILYKLLRVEHFNKEVKQCNADQMFECWVQKLSQNEQDLHTAKCSTNCKIIPLEEAYSKLSKDNVLPILKENLTSGMEQMPGRIEKLMQRNPEFARTALKRTRETNAILRAEFFR